MEVLRDGLTVIEVADRYGVSRQTVHGWPRRYATGGLDALADRSHPAPTAPWSATASSSPRPGGDPSPATGAGSEPGRWSYGGRGRGCTGSPVLIAAIARPHPRTARSRRPCPGGRHPGYAPVLDASDTAAATAWPTFPAEATHVA